MKDWSVTLYKKYLSELLVKNIGKPKHEIGHINWPLYFRIDLLHILVSLVFMIIDHHMKGHTRTIGNRYLGNVV